MSAIHSIIFSVCILGAVAASAADRGSETLTDGQVIRLWQDKAPGAMGDSDKDIPTLTVSLASHPNGAVMIICPGGGYQYLSPREGMPIAKVFNADGITAFVLKYRYGPYHHPVEMEDVQRAIRTVRFHAKDWNLDPNRIAILGFSAGGHIASTAATHFDSGNADASDPVDRVNCRPDLAILIYPVITMTPPYMHVGSHNNLLGEHADPKLEKLLSNNLQVTKRTPPCFILTTADDRTVPVENSLLFAEACAKNHVPFELHIFEHGRHGFALGDDDPILRTWPRIAADWLGRYKFTNAH